MKFIFTTTVLKDSEMNATSLQVPDEIVVAMGKGKRPPVRVALGSYTYRTTVAVMGGMFLLPLAAVHREKAGVAAGQVVDVTIELDTEPRTVEIPDDLAAALAQDARLAMVFSSLSHSRRKEYVRQVTAAKTQATWERRIAKILAELRVS